MDAKRVGAQLRKAREARRLTVEQVADLIGKHKQTVHRYEWGQVEPSYDALTRMARLYRVSVASIADPKNARP